MSYEPKPVDTDSIEITEELRRSTEEIARSVHDAWAAGRIKDGWVYGPKLDGEKKTTPNLVDYSDLTESEKDVDRATVTQTIKMLLHLGYKIEREEKR